MKFHNNNNKEIYYNKSSYIKENESFLSVFKFEIMPTLIKKYKLT